VQFLRPIGARPDHHQGAEPIIIQPDVEMVTVHSDIDILASAQIALAKIGKIFLSADGPPRDTG
jgi:hypothetical protein